MGVRTHSATTGRPASWWRRSHAGANIEDLGVSVAHAKIRALSWGRCDRNRVVDPGRDFEVVHEAFMNRALPEIQLNTRKTTASVGLWRNPVGWQHDLHLREARILSQPIYDTQSQHSRDPVLRMRCADR